MRNKIIHSLLTLAITLTCLISTPLSLTTRAANADGSITKRATEITSTCSGGTSSACSGSAGHTISDSPKGNCSNCGGSLGYTTRETCNECGALLFYSIITITHTPRTNMEGKCSTNTTRNTTPYSHGYVTSPCSHGRTSSHTVYTGVYQNISYGYNGYSSTFKVWPITIVGKNGLTGTVSVSSATANDAAISGKSVTVKVTGVTSGTKLKITNSGTGATVTPTPTSTSYNYTFTMPSKVTTITIELAQVAQSIAASLSSSTVGYGSRPTLTVTGAKTTLSHASSNASVASIDTNGNITINGLGSTTFTITAAESSDYYSASITVTLTVVKGNLSMKTAPSCSSISYGQVLSASTLSGGSVVNESSTAVDGTWSWKTPTTVPNAGKFAFVATYKPVDIAHYNY